VGWFLFITGWSINALITAAYPGLPGALRAVLAALLVVMLIGIAVTHTSSRRTGWIMVIIGGIGFVPIGLIALVGARKILEARDSQRFFDGLAAKDAP
jgi:hypothetical protein